MTKTRALQVRLTIAEHERLKALARTHSLSLAGFVRLKSLSQDFVLHDQILDIHRVLVGKKKPRPCARRPRDLRPTLTQEEP